MKRSWNADLNWKTIRLGVFSVIALMGLLLSTGSAMAADDFKLWQLRPGKAKPVALQHIKEEESTKAVKWLATDFSEENLTKFVSTFRSEPFKFVEGFKAAMLKSIETGKLDTFKKNLKSMLGKEDVRKAFGTPFREAAFKMLIEAMEGKSKEELEKEGLLKELFDDAALKANLGLIDEDPSKAKASPSPSASPSVSPSPSASGDDTLKKAIAEMNKKMEKAEADRKALEEKLREAQNRPQPSTPPLPQPSTPVTPVTSVPPPPPAPIRGPGEVSDAALQAQAQQVCDKMNAIRKAGEDNFNQLKDQINGLFNGLAELSRQPDRTQFNKKDKNELENLLPALLADSLKKDNNQNFVPPPQPQIQQARRNDNDRNNDKGIFDQPPPAKQDEPEQPNFFQPPTLNSSGVPVMPKVDVPTISGRQELRAVQDMNSVLDPNMRTSALSTLSAQSPITDLVMAKANIQYDRNRGKVALANAKDKLSRLDEEIENYKDGARSNIDPQTKMYQQKLQQEVEQKKRDFETQSKQLQAMAAQGGNAQTNAAAAQSLNTVKQQYEQAEQKLNEFNTRLEIEIEQGNKKIKSLAKQRDRLQSETTQLEGYLSGLKSEEDGVQALVNQQMQAQLAAINGANQPVQGTPNVNKIMSGGSRPPSSRLGGLAGAANAGAGGIPSRGSLTRGAQ